MGAHQQLLTFIMVKPLTHVVADEHLAPTIMTDQFVSVAIAK